jgi:hypothetical protein
MSVAEQQKQAASLVGFSDGNGQPPAEKALNKHKGGNVNFKNAGKCTAFTCTIVANINN